MRPFKAVRFSRNSKSGLIRNIINAGIRPAYEKVRSIFPYDKQNERKIEIYHGMGFREHTNLILTTEEDIENPGVLDGIIERFLLS